MRSRFPVSCYRFPVACFLLPVSGVPPGQLRDSHQEQALEGDVGAVIMLGTLFGLIVLIFALVLRYDPEARGPSEREDGDG